MAHQLCKLEDLPRYLQFNRDILTGYRRPMSGRDCVKSLQYLHNESFNCYSHIIGLLYFIMAARDYQSIWPSSDEVSDTSRMIKLFVIGDYICSTVPLSLSIIYHTFMPHHSGEKTYTQLLKLDIFGVWWCCTLGPISSMVTVLYCSHHFLLPLYATLYSSLSAYVLYYLMIVDCKRKRVAALTAQFFLRILLHPVRLSSPSHSGATKYYLLTDIVSAVGALVNALHVPERWIPGRVDYVLNGHTLMHVSALVSLGFARYGFLQDMTWMNTASCTQ